METFSQEEEKRKLTEQSMLRCADDGQDETEEAHRDQSTFPACNQQNRGCAPEDSAESHATELVSDTEISLQNTRVQVQEGRQCLYSNHKNQSIEDNQDERAETSGKVQTTGEVTGHVTMNVNAACKEIQPGVTARPSTDCNIKYRQKVMRAESLGTEVQAVSALTVQSSLPLVRTTPHCEARQPVTIPIPKTSSDLHPPPRVTPTGDTPLYSQILQPTYQCESLLDLPVETVDLCLVMDDQLWAVDDQNITVFGTDLVQVKTIHHGQETSGITYNRDRGHVVLAHDEMGLVQYSVTPPHRTTHICDGQFADVFYHMTTHKLYALMYEPLPSVLIFSHHGPHYVREHSIMISYTEGDCYDRLCVRDDDIYISSHNNDTIYRYCPATEILQSIGTAGDLLGPSLCGVDEYGDILVADSGNDRVQVYTAAGEWLPLRLTGKVVKPIYILITEGGATLFVLCDVTKDNMADSSRLLKFTVTEANNCTFQ